MAAQTATGHNKLGFPTVECNRCGGRGHMGEYDHVDAGRCFKCQGTGRALTTKGAKAYAAYLEALDAAAKKPAGDFKVGEKVRVGRGFGTITALDYKEHGAFKTLDGKEWAGYTDVTFHFANSRCDFHCRADMDLTGEADINPADYTAGL